MQLTAVRFLKLDNIVKNNLSGSRRYQYDVSRESDAPQRQSEKECQRVDIVKSAPLVNKDKDTGTSKGKPLLGSLNLLGLRISVDLLFLDCVGSISLSSGPLSFGSYIKASVGNDRRTLHTLWISSAMPLDTGSTGRQTVDKIHEAHHTTEALPVHLIDMLQECFSSLMCPIDLANHMLGILLLRWRPSKNCQEPEVRQASAATRGGVSYLHKDHRPRAVLGE